MLIEILFFLFLGICAGVVTGLTPGIHVNLVGAVLLFFSKSSLSFIEPIYLAVFIVSMSIAHTFLDFIPSIFLGAPEEGTELSVLPGHRLLKKGLGYEAIKISAYSGLLALVFFIFLIFPLIEIIPKIYFLIQKEGLVAYFLIFISLILIFSDKKRLSSFFIFILSGILGLLVLRVDFREPLVPLLSGLFGASTLILSIKSKTKIPKQKITNKKSFFVKPVFNSALFSSFLSMFPGIGTGQIAVIGSLVTKTDDKKFLSLLGATNTMVMALSFVFFYSISKTRTGSAVFIENLLGNLPLKILIFICVIILISGVISFLLTLKLGKFFSKKISELNYSKLSKIVLLFLFFVTFLVSGFIGIIVLVVSTITGIYCISLGVKRTQMMGCLLLPTIIFYLTN
jgi:putative membrane protein